MLLGMPALRATLERNQRLIGLDPGSRTIGVALSDVGLTLASPYSSIRRAAGCATTPPRSRRSRAGRAPVAS